MADVTHFAPSPSQGRSGATSPAASRTRKSNTPIVFGLVEKGATDDMKTVVEVNEPRRWPDFVRRRGHIG